MQDRIAPPGAIGTPARRLQIQGNLRRARKLDGGLDNGFQKRTIAAYYRERREAAEREP
jgi:hypothetical protein